MIEKNGDRSFNLIFCTLSKIVKTVHGFRDTLYNYNFVVYIFLLTNSFVIILKFQIHDDDKDDGEEEKCAVCSQKSNLQYFYGGIKKTCSSCRMMFARNLNG